MRTLTFIDTKTKVSKNNKATITSATSRLTDYNQATICKEMHKLHELLNDVLENQSTTGVAIKSDDDEFDLMLGKKISGNRCVANAQHKMAKKLAKASDQAYKLYNLLDKLSVNCLLNEINMTMDTNEIIEMTDELRREL